MEETEISKEVDLARSSSEIICLMASFGKGNTGSFMEPSMGS